MTELTWGGGSTVKTPTAVAYSPSVANPLTARMGKGINTTLDEGQTPVVIGGSFDRAQPYTLEVRGREDGRRLEYRQDGVANSLRSSTGGRDGVGSGAVAIPRQTFAAPATDHLVERPIGFYQNLGSQGGGVEEDVSPTLKAATSNNLAGVAYGFYANEGSHGIGDNANVSPAIKIDSGAVAYEAPAIGSFKESSISGTLTRHTGAGAGETQNAAFVLTQDTIAGPLDAHYGKGPGSRAGGERECVAAYGFDPTGSTVDTGEETAPSLRGAGAGRNAGHHAGVVEQSVVRRLTPVECCRLQGFPDTWNEEGIDAAGKRIQMADGNRYKQLGNAVTVNVANYLARNLAKVYAADQGD